MNTSSHSKNTLDTKALTKAGTSQVVSPSATSANGARPNATSNSRYLA